MRRQVAVGYVVHTHLFNMTKPCGHVLRLRQRLIRIMRKYAALHAFSVDHKLGLMRSAGQLGARFRFFQNGRHICRHTASQ